MKNELCDSCKNNTDVISGWHLDNGLNFCSNLCVSKYLEKLVLPITLETNGCVEK